MRVTVILLLCAAALPAGAVEFRTFDPSAYSQHVTECDRQAAHPDDPFKVLPGLGTSEMNLPAAILACERAVKADPGNPRLVYQLARSLTYAGRVKEALPFIERAAAADYPQALFVTGYLYLEGVYDAPRDPCRAGALIRRSGEFGRAAGLIGFPKYALEGRFEGCEVGQDRADLVAMLEKARESRLDYYAGLLVDVLLRDLGAAPSAGNAQ